MALTDAIPAPGVFDMLQLAASLAFAGPLVVATVLFARRGDVAMAAFCGAVALVALYLPTFVLERIAPSSILPGRLRRLFDRWPFR